MPHEDEDHNPKVKASRKEMPQLNEKIKYNAKHVQGYEDEEYEEEEEEYEEEYEEGEESEEDSN